MANYWTRITYRVPDGEHVVTSEITAKKPADDRMAWAIKHQDTIIRAEMFKDGKCIQQFNGWAFNDEVPF